MHFSSAYVGEDNLLFVPFVHPDSVENRTTTVDVVNQLIPNCIVLIGDNKKRFIVAYALNGDVNYFPRYVYYNPRVKGYFPVLKGSKGN